MTCSAAQRPTFVLRWAGLLALAPWALGGTAAVAQIANPVYVDVSPVARDALARAREMAAGGNLPQSARELQRLLDEHANRVVQAGSESDLFHSVRSQVHATLLKDPALLAQYLGAEEAKAQELLRAGTLESARRVETTHLLTTAGFEAALRVAQAQLESACFEAARRTVEQLEEHPLRRNPASGAGRNAAELLARVTPYLGTSREEVRARAARWAAESGGVLPPDAGPAERPPALAVPITEVRSAAMPLEAGAIPARPLWSAPIEPPGAAELAGPPPPNIVPLGAPKDPESLWALPTVAGDTLYLNDGTWITARDRFTLQIRWSVEPGSGEPEETRWSARTQAMQSGASRVVEDTNSVTLSGRLVLATTGIAREGSRDGDPRTHALDAETGRPLWSVHVPALDPQLESGSVRGPVMVDGDTVIVAVRKSAMARRIVSVYLVGLELRTGALRWVRLIASAGALPFNRERRINDPCVLDGGIVYACDQLGAAAAVEASTGRPVWVRRMPVSGVAEISLPWRWSSPLVHGPAVLMLSPDHRALLRLDARTGELLGERAAGSLGEPDYLVRAGDRLGAVGDQRVALVSIDAPESAPVTLTRAVPDPGLRGRVVVAGDRLLLPRADGISVVDPAKPDEVTHLPLEAAGTALPIGNQLLVIDARDVHSYLAWPVAQSLLRQRMAIDPASPDPACTYAELAYRAGRPEEVPQAADLALAAIERDPGATAAARARLFRVLREMVDASQDRWNRPAGPDPRAPVLDQAVLAAVIERMGRAAVGPEDRVTHLMALGRLREAEMSAAAAIDAYQRILADTALAEAAWRGPGVRVRASVEAAGRVRRVVSEFGAGVYAAFDAEASVALAALGPAPTAGQTELLARRYPAAAGNPALWLRVSEQRARAGEGLAALDALREGLAAADLSRTAGRAADAATEAELAGRLITELVARDRVYTASRLMSSLRSERPGLVPTHRGTPLDLGRVAADIAGRLAALHRLPRIGRALRPDTQAIDGWAIMTPVSTEGAPVACEHIMLASPKASKVALWGIPGVSPAGRVGVARAGEPHLGMLWSRDYQGIQPRLLRVDPDSVYLMWDGGDQGPSVERIDAVSGATVWRTDPLRTLFAADPAHRARLELDSLKFETPAEGICEARHVVWTMDEQSMIVAERIGRLAAFDPDTGRLLWKEISPVSRIFDLDVRSGLLAIGGASAPDGNPEAVANLSNLVRVQDARTGETVRTIDTLATPVRWLRLVPPGATGPTLLVATEAQLIAFDPEAGAPTWEIDGGPAFDSIDSWVFGDRMFVLTRQRELWMVSLTDGRATDGPLDTFNRLTDAAPIEAMEFAPNAAGSSHIAFLSRRGALVFDPGRPGSPPAARLVGIDALTRPTEPGAFPDAITDQDLVTPAPAEGLFVTLETWQSRLEDGRPAYALHLLDASSGKLQGPAHSVVLWDVPRRVAVLDGRIVVTSGLSGPVTLVYSAPEPD